MEIACPSCATRYNVPDETIGAQGRRVKCALCGTRWHARRDDAAPEWDEPAQIEDAFASQAPADVPGASPDEPGVPATIDVPAREAVLADAPAPGMGIRPNALPPRIKVKRPPRRGIRPMRAFVGGMALAAGAMLFSMSENIVRLIPRAASLYQLAGVTTNLRGLDFQDVRLQEVVENGQPMLEVSGRIVSLRQEPVAVPALRFALSGPTGKDAYVWTKAPDAAMLGPGQSLPFTSRLAEPPEEVEQVQVRFVDRHEVLVGMRP
jgi:predicted Zn finger-like uncharacterized protein